MLFLDTRPLHAVLMQNVVMLEQKVRNNPLSERVPRRAEQLNLLTKLASQVDPEFRPVARRGERTDASGSIDAIVGFAKISGFLRDDEIGPMVDREGSSRSFGDVLEIATFGRRRNEDARALDVVRRRLATYAAPGGAREIRDVSQTGYRLVALMTVITSMTLGTLTAIRSQGNVLWMLGIVRRMKRLTNERAEIGLQIIKPTIWSGGALAEQRRGESDYTVDGEIPTVNSRRFHGLFLSLEKTRQRRRDSDAGHSCGGISGGQAQLCMSAAKSSSSIKFRALAGAAA